MTKASAKAVQDAANKLLGKDGGHVFRLSEKPEPVAAISTGCLALDLALGVGGLPRGRVVEIYGPECLDAETFIQYAVWGEDGERHNAKGGSIERLYERFHGLPASGDVRGKYQRPTTKGAAFTAPCMNEEGRIFHNRIVDVVSSGQKECFELRTEGGLRVIASTDHRFWTGERFQPLSWFLVRLDDGQHDVIYIHNNTPYSKAEEDEVADPRRQRFFINVKNHPVAGRHEATPVNERTKTVRTYAYHRLARSRAVVEASMNGLTLDEYVTRLNDNSLEGLLFLEREDHVHHLDENHGNDRLENLVVVSASAHGRLHALERHNNLRFAAVPDRVLSIQPVGMRRTYDVCMEAPFNNFVADGFIVHNSGGKTTLTLHAVAEAQRLGLVCGFVDAEHALDATYAERLGVNVGDLLLVQPDNGEQGLEAAEALYTGGAGLVVIDSVAALTPKAELDGDMGDSHMGLHARLMSQALRKMTAGVAQSGAVVIFINQIRMKIGIVYGNPETTTGGNALKFYASVRLEVRRGKSITAPGAGEGSDPIGVRTRVKVVKNKVAPPFREAEFDMIFGSGVSRGRDILDAGVTIGAVEQSGAWYSYGGERIGQGREKTAVVLQEKPALAAAIAADVRRRAGLPEVQQ